MRPTSLQACNGLRGCLIYPDAPTAEMTSESGVELEDPLEEDKDSPVPGLTHRYPDRVLMVTTHVSTMHCRFRTRERVTMYRDG